MIENKLKSKHYKCYNCGLESDKINSGHDCIDHLKKRANSYKQQLHDLHKKSEKMKIKNRIRKIFQSYLISPKK